ncbi:MAG: hypothetical protein ABIP71_09565 [Verrucomicrobiota bacterium]
MKKVIIAVIGVALIGVIASIAVPAIMHRTDAKVAKFTQDADNLVLGLQQYREFMGHFPTGSLIEISKALSGRSTQGDKAVVIIVGGKNELNTKGEIVDPWGTPIQVYFSQNGILIRSAGPNKVFEDSKAIKPDDLLRSS